MLTASLHLRFSSCRYCWTIIWLCLSSIIVSIHATPEDNLILSLKPQVPEWRPEAVVDIGANKGKYSSFIHRMYPSTAILLLEADDQHVAKLQQFCESKDQVEYQIAVLSHTDQLEVSWFGGGDTGNSMFKEQSSTYENDVPVKKVTQTLDSLIKKSHIASKKVGLIKVDVQGAELVVLQGATETLAEASFVQIEASTVQYNAGGACTWQVDEFLRSHGYALYDLGDRNYYPPHFKTPGLGQYDVIYINTRNLPPSTQNASFCGGYTSSSIESSMVELETLVTGSATCSHKGSGGMLLVVGMVLGYVASLLQRRYLRFRPLPRSE